MKTMTVSVSLGRIVDAATDTRGPIAVTRRGTAVGVLYPVSFESPAVLTRMPVDKMGLEAILADLERRGCFPGISRRGQTWRAHVNLCGNQWNEGRTALQALRDAVKGWESRGRPMDGLADVVERVREGGRS